MKKLTEDPVSISPPLAGWATDLVNLQKILTAVHEHFPIRGLLTGAPMLVHLNNSMNNSATSDEDFGLIVMVQQTWRTIGNTWRCPGFDSTASNVSHGSMHAVELLSECHEVQEALGMSKEEVARRLALFWSPKIALYGCKHFDCPLRQSF